MNGAPTIKHREYCSRRRAIRTSPPVTNRVFGDCLTQPHTVLDGGFIKLKY